MLSGSPQLEVLKLGEIYSGNAFYVYNRFSYSSLCSGKTKLRDVYIGKITFPYAGTQSSLASFFSGCTSLKTFDFNNSDTSLNISLVSMFYNCSSIETIDLSWMKTNSVTAMTSLFRGCSSLKSFDISGFNYEQVTTIAYMFSGTGLEHITLEIENAPLLTNATYLFSGSAKLKSVDLTKCNFNLITSASNFFSNCSSLETLDLSYLSLPKVTAFEYMFNGCSSLEELNLSNITTSANVAAAYMFQNCLNLKKLDIRNWQINKITTASNYTNIFTNVPASCQIIVKDESCRTWVKARKSTFNNIVLASEL